MDFFKKTVEDNQLSELAYHLIKDNRFKSEILLQMKNTSEFSGPQGALGPKGDPGNKGEKGEKGDSWEPALTFHSLESSSIKSKALGIFQLCALNKAGEQHASQACTCSVTREDSPITNDLWALNINLAPDVDGQCNCGAVCVSNR